MSAKRRNLSPKAAKRRIARINARPCSVGPFPDGTYLHLNGGFKCTSSTSA